MRASAPDSQIRRIRSRARACAPDVATGTGYAGRNPRNRGYAAPRGDRTFDSMATLHIEHAISDYTTWKAAFDRFAPVREKAGIRQHRIQRPIDNGNYVVIDLDFESAEQARAYSISRRQPSGHQVRTLPRWWARRAPASFSLPSP